MSILDQAVGFMKDLVLLVDRHEALTKAVDKLSARVEDHERRLIRIEALLELSMKSRGIRLDGDESTAAIPKASETLPPKD